MNRAFLLLLLIWGASAQPVTPAACLKPRSFDVAAIGLHDGDTPGQSITTSGVRFRVQAETIVGLVMYAYRLNYYEVALNPRLKALDRVRYDITAVAPQGSTPNRGDFRIMLRTLLETRFKLEAHREPRVIDVFDLAIARGGLRLSESAAPSACETSSGYLPGTRTVHAVFKNCGVDKIVDLPGRADLSWPVIDSTHLSGRYDGELTFRHEPDALEAGMEEIGPTAPEAVKKLGLVLTKHKQPVNVLIVDGIDKVSEN